MYYVYVYYEPVIMKPFYVGKGSDRRIKKHLEDKNLQKHTYFYHKLNKMLYNGEHPIVTIFKDNISEREAFDLERLLIKHWGREDIGTGCLCNHTDGGEGASGCSHEVNLNHRVNMSIAQRSRSKASYEKLRQIKIKESGRPICSISLVTGKVVRLFQTISSAGKCGFSIGNISEVLAGRRQQHGGYFWRDCTIEELNTLKT